jgi:hypothetical protein
MKTNSQYFRTAADNEYYPTDAPLLRMQAEAKALITAAD